MEGGSLGEEQNKEFIRMLFSWLLDDIFNQDLYKNKVENIPLTFMCEEHYFGSFVYPLLEKTRAELASPMEIMYRAPFAEILSFNESKCGENMVYDVSVGPWKNPFSERGRDAYQTLPGNLLVLVDGKPESISDLRCLGRTWALSSIKVNQDDSTSLTIKVKASKPIEFQVGMFAVFVMNITTERRIWNSLHIHRNLNIIKEVLYSHYAVKENCNICCVGYDSTISQRYDQHLLVNLNESQRAAIMVALSKTHCCQGSSVEQIWGPPGTGKTMTVSVLLFILSQMNHRTLACAPTNVPIVQLASRLVSLVRESFNITTASADYFCPVGDVVLFGTKERLNVSIDIEEIFLEHRVKRLAGVLDLAQSVIDILYCYFVHSIDNLEPETSLISGEAPVLLESGNDENAIVTIFGGSESSGEVVRFGAEQIILVRDERAKTEICEYVGRQALVLTILECKGLEFHFFYENNFVMATMCFERAGDTIWEKPAKASSLRASADQMRGTNHEAFKSYVTEAAGIFESIGKLESAASCYCDLREYERAGDGDCDKFQDDSQQDGLVGAVKLFALALEPVERKIHSTTSQQSAGMLLSVSKRKHPENQLREKPEQLKGIYEKFKEDQHLEKCRKTLEGLETHQVQVKGMVEKQHTCCSEIWWNQTDVTKMQTERERQKRLHDEDHMSGNGSFGSNYQPCSRQARKMSIGLLVDSSQTKSKIGSGVAAELHTAENVKSANDVPAESKLGNGKQGMSLDLGRQNKGPRQRSSPPIRRKTCDQNTAYPKVWSLPSTNNAAPLQLSGNKIADNMEAGSYFANRMFNRDANEKKSKGKLNQREGGNHGTVGREEEFAYVTPKKVKGATEQGTSENVNSENILRMKVQESLGPIIVSSPNNSTQQNSEPFGMDVHNLKQQSKTNENDTLVAMDRQHLHTRRETNSGSLNLKTRKPVTRSASGGKKPQAQKSVPKKQSPLCQSKQDHLDDENAFSFVETWSKKRSNTDVSPGFKTFKRKERDELETRPVKTNVVVEEVHKDKSQKANYDGRKTKAAATNTSLNVNRKRDREVIKQNTQGVLEDKTQKATTDGRKTKAAATMNASLLENKRDKIHYYFDDDFMTCCQAGGNNGTTSNNHVDENPFANRSFTPNVEPQYSLKSQTFEFKSTAGISSPISSFEISDKDDVDDENSFKTKQIRSSHSKKGFSKQGHCNANTETNDHADVTDFDSLGEALTSQICSRLDLFEVTIMRRVNKSLRNLTMSAAFARDHKRRGMHSNWVITQYHTQANPDFGIIKAFRVLDGRRVTFDLQQYGINLREHQSLKLKCTLGSIFLFHVVPHGSLHVLNLSNGRVTKILIPNPPFNQESFRRIHEFKMMQDHEFNYKIIYAQVINERVEYFEYWSTDERWRNVIAQPVPNLLQVSTQDPRSLIFQSGQVRFVCFNDGYPVVLSQDAHHLTQQAFAQEDAFERNEEGARVVDELVNLWSRGSHGWFVIVESNDQDAFHLRIQGIVLFRLRGDWSGVELISRMQAELLPPHAYQLTQPLLEEVDGMVHLTFSAERLGGWGSLVFSFNPNSGGWTLREEHDATFTAIGASHTFITSLNMMPGVDA